jgi:S-adenosylmethionine:tRNA ribosyltransferase-isomerase
MRLEDFDFDLPEELIALRPARPRPAARLLVAERDRIADSTVARLGDWLRPGDTLVLNDTRVIPARLAGTRTRRTTTGSGVARIEVTLVAGDGGPDWEALARPARRLRPGETVAFAGGLSAEVLAVEEGGRVRLRFDRGGAELAAALAATGEMPLPPYIAARRPADASDRDDYQTVFAARPGAVAAPTASLHFDDALLARLEGQGVRFARLTLHVGAGTFLPVKGDVAAHRMHAEWGEIAAPAAETINATRDRGGRVIAVGTTALRLLETAATGPRRVAAWRGETDIFLKPGHVFLAADGLMTNFHLPRSTLIMLVAAFVGMERMRAIYAHAVESRYRFFSYGDSSLLLPNG